MGAACNPRPANPPLIVDDFGYGWIVDPLSGHPFPWRLYAGCALTHWPVHETDSAVVHIRGGVDLSGPGGLLFTLSREGLKSVIADLQQMVDQLEARG